MLVTVESSARKLIQQYLLRAVFVAMDRLNKSIDQRDFHARDFWPQVVRPLRRRRSRFLPAASSARGSTPRRRGDRTGAPWHARAPFDPCPTGASPEHGRGRLWEAYPVVVPWSDGSRSGGRPAFRLTIWLCGKDLLDDGVRPPFTVNER
jgi:hypothetical protein